MSTSKEDSTSPQAQARALLKTYFTTTEYPFVRHHIDSYDQFLSQDLPAVIKANNPFLIVKGLVPETGQYQYRVEVYVGGESGTEIEIGSPTLNLGPEQGARLLFPNEARLRGLTYAATVVANVLVKISILPDGAPAGTPYQETSRTFERLPLFQIPIMLHSRYCILNGKPPAFLTEAGECYNDQGGYFVVTGAEKILVTRQEQAFNTLYAQQQPRDPKVATYGNLMCLSPITRVVKTVSFHWMRETDSLVVTIPYVRKPIPVFVLFRAMGVVADEDILRLLYPDLDSSEARQMVPLLLPSLAEAFPFLDTFSAVQYIKAMTKGFSVSHVYDILFNQVFIHITDSKGSSRVHSLAEAVRKFLRIHVGIDGKTDRDDTRNQRCMTSGVLIRMLFTNAYTAWKKAVRLSIDNEYAYNTTIYKGEKFVNVFSEGNTSKLFNLQLITEMIMRGFKGKWVTGGSGGGGALGHSDEKTGVLQALSRISYLDFMSHCRRVVLNFDTGMKITGPRQLHTSQYGYYCTSETPGGGSIGIAKNLSIMTLISTATNPDLLTQFLSLRGWIIPCSDMRTDLQLAGVPVLINNGILGYTLQPRELTRVLKLMKWTGCLPALASISFSIRDRRVLIYLDEGRPARPLFHLAAGVPPASSAAGRQPPAAPKAGVAWRDLVLGTLPATAGRGLSTSGFLDPLASTDGRISLETYESLLAPHAGSIEYIDPYEQNEAFIVNFPNQVTPETSHLEIHPSTIVSIVTSMIPFANFNQSPRNQLSCSQSKQGLSMYATNFQNRYDNSANIMCYGEAPLVRTFLYDILGRGEMPYGHTITMAIMPFLGYNQDDGMVFNGDAFQRGLFRNINYRSYTVPEGENKEEKTIHVIGHPEKIPEWNDLRPGVDYSKLDERGIIRAGELVDSRTILVARYVMKEGDTASLKDASLTAQVWTHGRVESVVVVSNAKGERTVKVRITQDRMPELGDKFSTRHGQKGTIGMIYRAHDMPRTADGLVPDLIVNPHCIPSRMTVAQLLEMLFGKVCWQNSMIGDATLFMSDKTAPEAIGRVLEGQFGLEKAGNDILYDGASGVQMPTSIFVGPVFGMRLKHMTEDKWNARGEGRREQRTHQPTGGRGAEGGLRIGEMERDGLIAHGGMSFLRESMMERSDGTTIQICTGCGTVPVFNEKQGLFVCSLCDGPPRFIGSTGQTLEILPTMGRSQAQLATVEIPYATKLLGEELQTYLNMSMRILTAKGVTSMTRPGESEEIGGTEIAAALSRPLPVRVLADARVPEYREAEEAEEEASATPAAPEDLYAAGQVQPPGELEEIEPEEAEGTGPVIQLNVAGAGAGAGAKPRRVRWQNEEEAKGLGQGQAQGQAQVAGVPQMMQTQMPPTLQGMEVKAPWTAAPAAPAPPGAPAAPGANWDPFANANANAQQQPQPQQQSQQQATNPFNTSPVPMQQQPQPLQPQFQQGGFYMAPYQAYPQYQPFPPTFMPFPGPQQGPPTIAIDTSPQAMAASFEDYKAATQGAPVMGSSGGSRVTPRNRGASPQPRKGMTTGGQTITPTTKVMIQKLG